MDWKMIRGAVPARLKKYRFPLAVVLVGLILMQLPSGRPVQPQVPPPVPREEPDAARQLEQILSRISGVGEVQVLLTERLGREVIFQQNEDISNGDNTSSIRRDTMTVEGAQRQEEGLVRQIIPAVYQGAIVVCQGAEDPVVRLQIAQAVSRITGLGTDRISVLKMK